MVIAMGGKRMKTVRCAEPDDLDVLHDIERDADQLFAHAFGAVPWADPPSGPDRSAQPGFILVAGRPAVGFSHLLDLDGHAHLEQLSVVRSHQRLGLGGLLLEATAQEARRRGYDQLTLCTFDGLGWNAPFYGRHGFIEISEAEIATMPYLAPLRAAERAEKLDSYGRRLVMVRQLSTRRMPPDLAQGHMWRGEAGGRFR